MGRTGLGIGAVAQLTGIPAPTLRTWEMRYGAPAPTRGAGGQRVYAPSVVDWLGLVQAAIDQGLRAGQALQMSEEELRAVLGHSGPSPRSWLEAAIQLDPDALERRMLQDYTRVGGRAFVTECAVPFLAELGRAWADGRIDVQHEHVASGRLSAFVSERWRPLSAAADGAPVLLVALPGEQHTLGLELAALVLATAGRRVLMLGALPASAVAETAAAVRPVAVAASVSSTRGAAGLEDLAALRAALPGNLALLCGGAGAGEIEGVEALEDFDALRRRFAL